MRLFKVPPKRVDAEETPNSASTFSPVDVPADQIIDVDAVMASSDERDDSAPVGVFASQRADGARRTEATDVAFTATPEAPQVTEQGRSSLFDRFKRKDKTAPTVSVEQGASAAQGLEPKKSRIALNWGSKKAAQAAGGSATVHSSSIGADATGEVQQEGGPVEDVMGPVSGAAAYVPATDEVQAGSRFAKLKAKFKSEDVGPANGAFEAPIRVLIGFLPEVSVKDANEFAQGVAAKHIDNLGQAYYDAFKHDNGYAYEVHEGGPGRAYLPAMLKYYKSLGAFNPEDDNKLVIRTGTRAVEVSRARNGLSAVLLPEETKPAMAAWLKPTTAMRPAINKRTGVLIVGASLFVSGFLAALTSGFIFRLQPYEPAVPVKMEEISYLRLPYSQWPQLQVNTQDRYVKALKYEKGNWRVETESIAAAQAQAAQAAPDTATPPAPPAPGQPPVAPESATAPGQPPAVPATQPATPPANQ